MRSHTQTLKNNQHGMAAILIVTVLMFVISIIVLGFAQVVRREQRNALDNQLATQAYYAAESGLNLAQNKIQSVVTAHGTVSKKTACNDNARDPDYRDVTSQFGIGENAEVTCMLIDPELEYLDYQNIGMTAVPLLLKAKSDTISDIFISWELSTKGAQSITDCNGGGNFTPNSDTRACKQPLLRVDVVPVGGVMTADSVKNSQFTAFLSPDGGSPPTVKNYAAGSVNNLSDISCSLSTRTDSPRTCTARISIQPPYTPQQAYALRIMSIYGDSNVTVFAENATGTRVTLVEGQVLIDVTAKAADVLKRLQARMPVSGGANVPDFALTAGGGVCKRYQISAGIPSIDGVFPECNL
jgi:hypothetical protein